VHIFRQMVCVMRFFNASCGLQINNKCVKD
jgi:hypothetical protein